MNKTAVLSALSIAVIMQLSVVLYAQEPQTAASNPDQQLTEFNLVGYGEQGKKNWQVDGKSADIFNEQVVIDDFQGKIYGDQENIDLQAEKGNLDKGSGTMHLEGNVVATTSSGSKLTTDSLDWDQKGERVTTRDPIQIERENLKAQGRGAMADPGLKNVLLERDVKVEIQPKQDAATSALKKKEALFITCDGPLDVNYDKNEAVFQNNVKTTSEQGEIYCDTLRIFFITGGKEKAVEEKEDPAKDLTAQQGMFGLQSGRIEKIIAEGNVKIIRGENVTFCEKAVYSAADKKITLMGRPKLFLYTQDGGM
jgi:LPS export ABC transporter protein LptC